ncbi:interferon alpha-inducible protein 27-like protein 2 isoform X2 [Corvus hawaiiensis]|uniref:interferon alpha-inducible protein 27-like protein 2 isoform X2 n=1 Tax=Corvus hawaiiensis TaxID=134902 RepID=UPI0020190B42|nr:interferon alpha-inducible protein 27-like protein 2 isoform X2 [Corvus hawaiiensis]
MDGRRRKEGTFGIDGVSLLHVKGSCSPGGVRHRSKGAATGAAAQEAVSAKMSKKKPTPDEELKKETISDEESGKETPSDEPKKETISDEESGEETTPGDEPKDEAGPGKKQEVIGVAIGATAGAAVALVGIPVFIGALGFTGAGIAAGSIAAKMMSAAAIANGGGVAAGSTVAVLQSIGAAGFSIGTKIGLTSALSTVGGASGAWVSRWKKPPSDKPKKTNSCDKHEEKTTPNEEPKRSQAGA